MNAPFPQEPERPHPEIPKPRSKWRRRFTILGAIMLVVSGCVASLPTLVSLPAFKPRLESQLSGALGAPVKVRAYGLGWLSGATIDGLEIGQPAGFSAERPLLALEHAHIDVAWLRALGGTIDIGGEIRGARLLVLQKKDGTLNVQQLGEHSSGGPHSGGSGPVAGGGPGAIDGEGATLLQRLRANFALRDATIDVVHEEKGTLESIRKLDATLDKRRGSTDFDLQVGAELAGPDPARPPGKLQIDADVDGTLRRPIDVQLTVAGFDFARYRPLADALLGADRLSALAGVVDGTVKARIEGLESVVVQGALTVDKPHFAGALLQGMNIETPKWVINPNAKLRLGKATTTTQVDLDGFSVDLGLLKVQGVSAMATGALLSGAAGWGLDFDLDLQALGKLGGPMPALLGSQPASVSGRAVLQVPPAGFATDDVMRLLRESVQIDARVKLPQLALGAATKLLGVDLPVACKEGRLTASLGPGATLNGGALTLSAGVDLTQAAWPASVEVGLSETTLVADALHALQFAVPVFAGLAQQAGAQIAGKGTVSLSLAGPASKAATDGVLAWLNHWSGGGKVALAGCSVRPAAAFAGLLQFADADAQGVLAMSDFATDFKLRQGGIEHALTKLDIKGRKIGIRGRTTLDGKLEHAFDLTALLEGHRDGEKVLRYLAGKPIEGALTGTLSAPRFGMPDVTALFTEALKAAAQQEIKKGAENLLQKGLDELLKKRK